MHRRCGVLKAVASLNTRVKKILGIGVAPMDFETQSWCSRSLHTQHHSLPMSHMKILQEVDSQPISRPLAEIHLAQFSCISLAKE